MLNRIAVFIDGANMYATTRALAFDIDYKRLLDELKSRGTLVRAFYYTAMLEGQEFNSLRPLIDWLDYNGYSVVTKPTKEFTDSAGHRKIKGNMDIEIVVDAMELAEHVDEIILFSGDGDFRSMVEAVQRRGVRVTVVSTIRTTPVMIADELRRQADVFTDLGELKAKIGRDPAERPLRARFMLDRQHGKVVFECDSCNAVLETETRDFDDALAIMKRKEWKAQKIGKDWIHACPDCEIDR